MLVADTYLGPDADPDIAARLEGGDPLEVTLSDTERRRSRVRTTATDGTDLGIVVGRVLADGDVLLADDRPVCVSLEPVDAMVVIFERDAPPLAALELGHAVGNRHWDMAIEDSRALLPAVEDRERMASSVRPLLPDGAVLDWESVAPSTFDDGPSGDRDHSHGPAHDDHVHGHDGDHGHSHVETHTPRDDHSDQEGSRE
jgi:urease accessory protein